MTCPSIRWLILAVGIVLSPWASPARGQSVWWDLTPYKVQVHLLLDGTPELTPALAASLRSDLDRACRSRMGARWDAQVLEPPPALGRRMLAGVEQLTFETVPQELRSIEKLDKLIVVLIQPGPAGYRIAARDLDLRTQIWNATVAIPVGHPAGLGEGVFAAVRGAFAPLAYIGAVEDKKVTLRFRGSALPTGDPGVLAVCPGDVFQPIVRRNDREGRARGINAVPWTFLVAEKPISAGAECRLRSGLRFPLNTGRRGRIEQLALGIVPPQRPTELVLQARTEPKRPLTGYDLYLYGEGEDPKSAVLFGRSDARGRVAVPPGPQALRLLLVKHGDEVLARLPVVPGLYTQMDVLLPDDDLRLEVESTVRGLHENLVDQVTQRELLLAYARAQLKAGQPGDLSPLVEQLQTLKSRHVEFRREVQTARQSAVIRDAAVQRKIDAMFAQLDKAVKEHLDTAAIDRVSDELRAAGRKK